MPSKTIKWSEVGGERLSKDSHRVRNHVGGSSHSPNQFFLDLVLFDHDDNAAAEGDPRCANVLRGSFTCASSRQPKNISALPDILRSQKETLQVHHDEIDVLEPTFVDLVAQ